MTKMASEKMYKKELEDLFLYTNITSVIKQNEFSATLETPFRYNDGRLMDISTDNDVVVGIAQRNAQQRALLDSRGKVIILYKIDKVDDLIRQVLIGAWNKKKNMVTLFATEKLLPEEIKMLRKIKKHLEKNKINVIIDINEKNRYRHVFRRKNGDRFIRRDRD